MQEKIISIPFDHDKFLKSQKIIWSFSFKKVLKSYIIYTVIPIILLVIGLKTESTDRFPVGIIFGSAMLFYILLKWSEVFEKRNKYLTRIRIISERFNQESMECTFIFSENEIEYKDKEKYYKLNWSLFNPYLIFKDTIFLISKDTEAIQFTFSRDEMSDENYNEICIILEEKIGSA